MTPWTIDQLRELAPGYVMGTLTTDEYALFLAALSDAGIAAELAPEIEAHRVAFDYLATSQSVALPAGLRQRVTARISGEREATSGDEARSMLLNERRKSPVVMPAIPAKETDRRNSERRAVRVTPQFAPTVRRANARLAWSAAGLFGLAMAASLFFALSTRSQSDNLQNQLQLQTALLKQAEQRLAYRDSTVNMLTHSDGNLMLVTLQPNDGAARAMQVFYNRKTGEAILHASGFAQVRKDRAYCLWLIRNGKPESVKLFRPDADGHRLINGVPIPGGAQGVSAFAVTEENAAGSPQPTMTPFLVGAVAPK